MVVIWGALTGFIKHKISGKIRWRHSNGEGMQTWSEWEKQEKEEGEGIKEDSKGNTAAWEV